ncbi:MAG: DNA topoisomerase IB [Shinella sp.]|nr:DNA topoisomerase IB [Shinella sp.]
MTAPEKSLQEVGLVYVSDMEPGIRRLRKGRGFCYRLPDGALLDDPETKARISALGLPPAYRDVWICLLENGHLQATGYDARGRKQYRYHKDWQALRSGDKFHQLAAFGKALPRIRRAVLRDLEGPAGDMTTTLAALTMLLDQAHLRIGNQAYTEENSTYGATTLLKRHMRLVDGRIDLDFTAKGGKRVRRTLRNPRLQRILEDIADLPGRKLFVWKGENGALHPIDSGRLNAYLAEISGIAISAKTFRTWAGSLAAFAIARAAVENGEHPTVKEMSEAAAAVLHNTPAICRSSYIHPDIVALADKGQPLPKRRIAPARRPVSGLRVEENRMLAFLLRASRKRARPADLEG